MKTFALLSPLFTAVLALPQGYETPAPPAPPAAPATPYFTAISARSASPVHLLPLNAIGGKFYLGGTPSSYCPKVVGQSVCDRYPGNATVLAGGFGTLSLGVVVPGGQQGRFSVLLASVLSPTCDMCGVGKRERAWLTQ